MFGLVILDIYNYFSIFTFAIFKSILQVISKLTGKTQYRFEHIVKYFKLSSFIYKFLLATDRLILCAKL